MEHILQTGLKRCYDSNGEEQPCAGTGQDGEYQSGYPWPDPRFDQIDENLIRDLATGLVWVRDANLFSFPMTWQEGLEEVARLNTKEHFGRNDWRLPNRREMRSLINHGARKPALPDDNPFENVFLGWYWTSTSAARAPGYAWYVHMEGGRMFYGRKDSYYLVWPVCGSSTLLPQTGQRGCFDEHGEEVDCEASGQDGELRQGKIWPSPRFRREEEGVADLLTGLVWAREGDVAPAQGSWEEALDSIATLAGQTGKAWRLPTINELESLVDVSRHSPALPHDHCFSSVQEAYWSSTTSFFEPDWAYVLYMHKGAVGVGFKKNRDFAVWPVLELENT
ncbi:MAG: DUF1566 domain-containing protein [Desulfopila sp.]|jgi:hypothetical protein|nr:DUF1566 domain-containing protein [Desulfopila sp.]